MSLYSFKGAEPAKLPPFAYLDNGLVRTDLYSLSDAQLYELGFTGPYACPGIDEHQYAAWDSDTFTYIIFDLPETYKWYEEKVVYNPATKSITISMRSPAEIQQNYSDKFASLRAERDKLFTEADFAVSIVAEFLCTTCEPEVLQYEQLITYKIELRDIFDNITDPFTVVFPSRPPKLDRVLQGQYGVVFKG